MLEQLLKMLGLQKIDEGQQEKASKSEERPTETKMKPEKKSYATYSCPFCGQGVLSFIGQTQATGGRLDGSWITLQCENCGARGPLAETHEECVEKWNRPALKHNELVDREDALRNERDALKQKLEERSDGLDELIKECLHSGFGWKTVSVSRKPARRMRSSKVGMACRKA